MGDFFYDELARRLPESAAEVVMVIRRPGNKALLTTKSFYPQGLYRLPSGRMEKGETPGDALMREVYEETGLRVEPERYLGAISYTFHHQGKSFDYRSHVFVTTETSEAPVVRDSGESITGFAEIELSRLNDVARDLRNAPGTWDDWGRFRAIAHEFVYRQVCARAHSGGHCRQEELG